MPGPRIALASINPTVGDLDGNRRLVVASVRDAVDAGCDVVAFPEMALTGYPVEDLALRRSFQLASIAAVDSLAADLDRAGLGRAHVVVGYLDVGRGNADPQSPRPTNSAAVLTDGRVAARYDKRSLPNYGVFDEERWFESGQADCVIEVDHTSIGIAICEDIWDGASPALDARRRPDVLLVINASPFEVGKQQRRESLCSLRARELGATVAYVNMVGGQDELVFDGGALVVDAEGDLVARAPRYLPGLTWFVPGEGSAAGAAAAPLDDDADIYAALTLGLRDYVEKNGIERVLLGLSGGIDSALVAALACDALGSARVSAVSMPSRYSSEHSVADARDLAERTGLDLRTVPIEPMFAAFQGELNLTGLAEENLQARIRGCILMAISNAEGHIVLATGNKSEIAVGYSTIYGDAVGGFAPIKDVPKTLVWRLARYRNSVASTRGEPPPIPQSSIDKPPSAELRPGQIDQDSLPDYAALDAVLRHYVELRQGAAELACAGFEPALVDRILRLTDRAEYKRRQYPIGTKITELAFGRDRRLPITNRWVDRA